MAVLGIHLGCYVHIAAAAAGLSVLFHAIPLLYTAVKLAGAVYLILLGISLFRSKGASAADLSGIAPKTGRRAFAESVTAEVLNPKTAIFFMAFLPQFIDPAAGLPVWIQLAVLGIVVNAMFSFADIVCGPCGLRHVQAEALQQRPALGSTGRRGHSRRPRCPSCSTEDLSRRRTPNRILKHF